MSQTPDKLAIVSLGGMGMSQMATLEAALSHECVVLRSAPVNGYAEAFRPERVNAFAAQARAIGLPLWLMGHSCGGDSCLRLARSLQPAGIILLDAVDQDHWGSPAAKLYVPDGVEQVHVFVRSSFPKFVPVAAEIIGNVASKTIIDGDHNSIMHSPALIRAVRVRLGLAPDVPAAAATLAPAGTEHSSNHDSAALADREKNPVTP